MANFEEVRFLLKGKAEEVCFSQRTANAGGLFLAKSQRAQSRDEGRTRRAVIVMFRAKSQGAERKFCFSQSRNERKVETRQNS